MSETHAFRFFPTAQTQPRCQIFRYVLSNHLTIYSHITLFKENHLRRFMPGHAPISEPVNEAWWSHLTTSRLIARQHALTPTAGGLSAEGFGLRSTSLPCPNLHPLLPRNRNRGSRERTRCGKPVCNLQREGLRTLLCQMSKNRFSPAEPA